jgi:hypothetical protein
MRPNPEMGLNGRNDFVIVIQPPSWLLAAARAVYPALHTGLFTLNPCHGLGAADSDPPKVVCGLRILIVGELIADWNARQPNQQIKRPLSLIFT